MCPATPAMKKCAGQGEYQIQASEKGKNSLELWLPEAFAAMPGERIQLDKPESGFSGTYLVQESLSFGGAEGTGTVLTLTGG